MTMENASILPCIPAVITLIVLVLILKVYVKIALWQDRKDKD